jgi:LysM repeat protein
MLARRKSDTPAAKTAAGKNSVSSGLRIGELNDLYEREADRVAEALLGDHGGPAWSLSQVNFGAGGECDECKQKQKPPMLQRKAADPAELDRTPSIVYQALSSPGRPLDRATRDFFEPRFGRDFSRVRVRDGAVSDAAARDVSAVAFTVGNNITFRGGHYSPWSVAGRRLLAHELVHVVQQGQAPLHAFHSTERLLTPQRVAVPTLQKYEASEHTQFGETGDTLRQLVAQTAFTYKVKPGELPSQIAEKFHVDEKELRSANRSKLKKWKTDSNPNEKVEGFYPGTAITISPVVNDATKEALKTNELALTINGVALSYGEGISMGDLFESPEQLLAAPPAELQKISELIKKEKSGALVTAEDWSKATGGRYLELAKKNEAHFAPSDPALVPPSGKGSADHKSEFEKHHAAALRESQSGDKNTALITNAFANHFLTDAFAAGHLTNKRDVMERFEGNLPRAPGGAAFTPGSAAFFDSVASGAFAGVVQTEFSKTKTVACYNLSEEEAPCSDWLTAHAEINSTKRFSKLLQGVHMKEPELFENVVVKGVHDKLNKSGVAVTNAKGDAWELSGDGTLNAKSLEIGRKAVAQSQLNVLEVFKLTLALNLPALFKKVWDYVPHPTAGAGKTQIQKAVSSGTDPTSAGLIGAAVALIKGNFKMIIEELIKRKKLMR